jgi:hypothetical protein
VDFFVTLQLLKEIQNAKDKMEEVKARQKDKRREELVFSRQIILSVNQLISLWLAFR